MSCRMDSIICSVQGYACLNFKFWVGQDANCLVDASLMPCNLYRRHNPKAFLCCRNVVNWEQVAKNYETANKGTVVEF